MKFSFDNLLLLLLAFVYDTGIHSASVSPCTLHSYKPFLIKETAKTCNSSRTASLRLGSKIFTS